MDGAGDINRVAVLVERISGRALTDAEREVFAAWLRNWKALQAHLELHVLWLRAVKDSWSQHVEILDGVLRESSDSQAGDLLQRLRQSAAGLERRLGEAEREWAGLVYASMPRISPSTSFSAPASPYTQ